jgi:RNase P subunit RPR2
MVMARLHVICGNCGCNDEFEWRHTEEREVACDVIDDECVYILCRNCGTLHNLSDNAKKKDRENSNERCG